MSSVKSKDFSKIRFSITCLVPFMKKRIRPEPSTDFPTPIWMSANTKKSTHPLVRLHNEILDYAEYITLTKYETQIRERSIQIITNHAKTIWPECEARTFGSYATGLSLTNSDVDLVIIVKGVIDPRALIVWFSKHLKEEDAINYQEEILTARVPILKIQVKETNVLMDISFNILDGVRSIEPVKALLDMYLPLKPLALVLKAFLRERKINETYSGGIGSFLLVVLTTAFLQYEKKREKAQFGQKTLGELLIGFFKFYGEEFNYKELGISIVGEGCFYRKTFKDDALSVESPQNIDIDIGRSVRLFEDIVRAFKFAYETLYYCEPALSEILHPIKARVLSKRYKS